MSCESYFNNQLATKFLSDPRVVTENAIKLTPDEMHAIYMDIFKPLDSFEMLYERLKAQEKEKKKEEQTGWRVNQVTEYAVNCDTWHVCRTKIDTVSEINRATKKMKKQGSKRINLPTLYFI